MDQNLNSWTIFGLKMMVKSGLFFVIFNPTCSFRGTCSPATPVQPFWAYFFALGSSKSEPSKFLVTFTQVEGIEVILNKIQTILTNLPSRVFKILFFEITYFEFLRRYQKKAKVWLSKPIFYVKNHPSFSIFFISLEVSI